jgi:hypothetical protein
LTPDEVYFDLPHPFAEAAWNLALNNQAQSLTLSSDCPINWVQGQEKPFLS